MKSFQISKLNLLDDGPGTMPAVSPYSLFMDINLKTYQGLSLFFSFVWKMTNVQAQY